MTATVHVVGAGLAGLSCAVALVGAGRRVRVYEAAGQAGGRCRSYHDDALDRRIDNGNHLMLSGNAAVQAYLGAIDMVDGLTGPARAEYPFLDLTTGERWTLKPGAGVIPWWIWSRRRRVPGTHPGDYLRGLRLARAGPGDSVRDCLDGDGPAYRRFWEPLAVAVLNTPAEEGAASLLWPVLRQTFGRGESACRPRMARDGLGPCFVDPAVAWLEKRGGEVSFARRVRGLDIGDSVGGLIFADGRVTVEPDDGVVLAVPPGVAADLVPGLVAPDRNNAIVNGHFRLPAAVPEATILGLVGGTSQWIFIRDDVASVTVSAAGDLADQPADEIARIIWPEVAVALELREQPMPRHRIVKERRATFAQTPDQVARRPGTVTKWPNLWLAGDWTDTGLPATIEGALHSGHAAAIAVGSTPVNS
jgi:squalene-associated FAD-dependent desaturase